MLINKESVQHLGDRFFRDCLSKAKTGSYAELSFHKTKSLSSYARLIGALTHFWLHTELNIYQVNVYLVGVMTSQYCTWFLIAWIKLAFLVTPENNLKKDFVLLLKKSLQASSWICNITRYEFKINAAPSSGRKLQLRYTVLGHCYYLHEEFNSDLIS